MTPRELVVEASCLSVQLQREGRFWESERILRTVIPELFKIADATERKERKTA